LDATLPFVVRVFLRRGFLILTAIVAVIALILISRQWETFLHTAEHFMTWQGVLFAGMTLLFTKIIHECGHAYMAKSFGCKIPSMGVAFMVMMSLLYTDTTAAWRLSSRRERLLVVAAGVMSEMSLGAWAAFAWCLLPDGFLKSSAFLLATTTWIMSLTINMIDGYYFLSDSIGVANLHQRSFAHTKHALREWLFGFGAAKPEEFPTGLDRGLILYAWAVILRESGF